MTYRKLSLGERSLWAAVYAQTYAADVRGFREHKWPDPENQAAHASAEVAAAAICQLRESADGIHEGWEDDDVSQMVDDMLGIKRKRS